MWLDHLPASVAFCDVETTGLGHHDRIVSFGGIAMISRDDRAVTCRLPIDTCTALEWSARSITILPHAVRSSPASQASPIDAREKRAGRSVDELAALGQPRAPRR